MILDTRQLILDKSEVLVRTRGYTAFSYADLAADLGVTKASVHYHFATKEELVLAIFRRCTERARGAMGGATYGGATYGGAKYGGAQDPGTAPH